MEYDQARLKHLGHKANAKPSKWRKGEDADKIHSDMLAAQVPISTLEHKTSTPLSICPQGCLLAAQVPISTFELSICPQDCLLASCSVLAFLHISSQSGLCANSCSLIVHD